MSHKWLSLLYVTGSGERHPDRSATVHELIRCTSCAGGMAGLQALIDAAGAGLSFTVHGLIGASCTLISMLLRCHGMRWQTAFLAIGTGKCLPSLGSLGTAVGKENI